MKKLTTLMLILASFAIFAEGEKEPLTIDFTGSVNSGNSDATAFNLSIQDTEELTQSSKLIMKGEAAYTRTKTEETIIASDGTEFTHKTDEPSVENGEASIRYEQNISDNFYYYIDSSYFRDKIADIDYRVNVGPGLGVTLLSKEICEIKLEAGFLPTWEKVEDESDYYNTLKFNLSLTHNFASKAKLWEQLTYTPYLGDNSKYLLSAEVGIESPINDLLSLKILFKNDYNSDPATDKEKNDLSLLAGIRINL